MIENIKTIPNERKNNLDYLKSSKLPLLLYGAGTCALWVKDFLDNEKIKVDYVVVDKDFYKKNTVFCNYPIRIIDQVINELSKVNIIVASGGLREGMKRFFSCKKVSKMVFFDVCNYTDLDNDFIETHYSVLEELYFKLEDDLSKEILVAFIKDKYTLSSNALYKLNVKEEKEYFPLFIHLDENEIFVDCGAYDGDTSLIFSQLMSCMYGGGGGGGIYAFECDKSNIEKLKKNTSHLKNIKIIEKGCWSDKTTLYFSNEGTMGSKISDNGKLQIAVDSIDNVVKDKVSFIKMDIEGSELEALKGAKNTILKYKPKLAVCVYHKKEDLITIPQYILSLNQNYKLYLRHYGENSCDTVLYAL